MQHRKVKSSKTLQQDYVPARKIRKWKTVRRRDEI